ncbi:MAG: carboxyl-terminal processing protease [Janthinobacterium sp.]|jgi:carboxyl-terminal processing protease
MVIKAKNMVLIGLGMAAGIAGSLQYSALAQKIAGAPLPLAQLRQLSDVFGLIKSDYVEPVEGKKLLSEAIAGMVASLDPHSVYLDKKSYAEMRESMLGKFVGIGIEVGMEDGYLKVVAPIEDSPAARAGIQAGDLITRLDRFPMRGLSLDDAIKKMRGEPKSKITLTIARKGEEQPLLLTIVREEIRMQSVKAKMIAPGYAWLRIAQFQAPTLADMASKINALYLEDPQLKGLVLDLRNDPGGVLQGAVGVAAAFLPKDAAIVSTNGQLPNSKQIFYGRREFYEGLTRGDALANLPAALKTVPLVVLVNAGSASASEIVAGALQDYKRATIIGTQTFGKGSVQTLRQLTPDTAIKLTTARYYTPHGRSIQARGIVPDLMVDETADGDGLNSLRIREADLQNHLGTDKERRPEAVAKKIDAQPGAPAAQPKKVARLIYGSSDDFQLAQALNHFRGLPVTLSKVVATPEKKDDGSALEAAPQVKSDAPSSAVTPVGK